MTIEERFERIEHVTAGVAEERRKDCDEFRQWRREFQRRLDEIGEHLVQMSETDERLERRIEQLAEESRAADKRLEGRIESLVSAIGKFLAKEGK